MTCSVEHHFDDALDVAVGSLKSADIHAEAAGNRRPDLFSVQLFPLDFATLEHVSGQGLQYGFLAEVETKSFHVADQPALPVADGRQGLGELVPLRDTAGPAPKRGAIYSP